MREPEHIRRDRSTARLVLAALAAAAVLVLPATALGAVPKLVFPIVGKVSYEDDFGDPRGAWTHQGNDVLAARKAPVVAVEAGRIRIWTSSATAGCMLYLHGRSGTTYLYIHLNNDIGRRNDNRGGCKPGVAYAPGLEDGDTVRAGELIAYVGDSGDADGGPTHLHFELHPNDADAVSPFRWLKRADKPLFAVLKDGTGRELQRQATIALAGSVVRVVDAPVGSGGATEPPAEGTPPAPASGGSAGGGSGSGSAGSGATTAPPPPPPPSRGRPGLASGSLLTIRVTTVTVTGGGTFSVSRLVTLALAGDVDLQGAGKRGLAALVAGAHVTVTSMPVALSLRAQLGRPGALTAAAISLG